MNHMFVEILGAVLLWIDWRLEQSKMRRLRMKKIREERGCRHVTVKPASHEIRECTSFQIHMHDR